MDKICKFKQYRSAALSVLFLLMVLTLTACGNKPVKPPVYDDSVDPEDKMEIFAIVSNIDEVNGKIKLRSVGYTSEVTLVFNGGADVKDKYGELLPMSEVLLGSVVDAVYDANRNKLLSLKISDSEALEKKEKVSAADIDYLEKTVKIDGKQYKMSNNVCAFSDNKEIGLDEICSEDQLSVWIYNNIVCSFNVELGHGYVKLVDYASYIGGMVEIGYDVIVPVTEDMLLTVREGTYTLRISKGGDSGTKEVKVEKNKEQVVSLADIAIEPKQTGSVLFNVKPSDAAVYVDRIRVNTEGAVELIYGKHRIDIIKDGYDRLSGTLTVKEPYKVKDYTLTEKDTAKESSTETKKTTAAATVAKNATEKTTEAATTEDKNTKDVNTSSGEKTNNKVTITAPAGASIYFDGEYLGIAPISFKKVTGSHIITLSQTGYLSKSYTVTFADDGEDKNLTYDALVSLTSLIE